MTSRIDNLFYNAVGIYVYYTLIQWLSTFIPAINIYNQEPIITQAILAFLFILIFFIFIIWLKGAALRNKDKHPIITKPVFYIPAGLFLFCDVEFNINFSWFFLQQSANYYGEGWTFTSHCKAIRDYTHAKLDNKEHLTALEKWRYKEAMVYGKIMNLVELGHF